MILSSELVIIIFYLLVVFFALRFLWISYEYRTSKKKYPYLAFAMVFLIFLIWFPYYLKNGKAQADLENVGTYTLTSYRNCKSCVAVLKSDKTYIVLDRTRIIHHGDWHYEVGQDYWIVYLDGKKNQLGSGDFQYSEFKKDNQTTQ